MEIAEKISSVIYSTARRLGVSVLKSFSNDEKTFLRFFKKTTKMYPIKQNSRSKKSFYIFEV